MRRCVFRRIGLLVLLACADGANGAAVVPTVGQVDSAASDGTGLSDTGIPSAAPDRTCLDTGTPSAAPDRTCLFDTGIPSAAPHPTGLFDVEG
jgi:hypothetical protein